MNEDCSFSSACELRISEAINRALLEQCGGIVGGPKEQVVSSTAFVVVAVVVVSAESRQDR